MSSIVSISNTSVRERVETYCKFNERIVDTLHVMLSIGSG